MRRSIGALTTKGAASPSQRRPATKVWVIQWPNGAFARSRFPLRERPRQTGHFGCGSGLVEKDEPMRLKPHARLARGDPFFARRFDIGAILLACQQRFF